MQSEIISIISDFLKHRLIDDGLSFRECLLFRSTIEDIWQWQFKLDKEGQYMLPHSTLLHNSIWNDN